MPWRKGRQDSGFVTTIMRRLAGATNLRLSEDERVTYEKVAKIDDIPSGSMKRVKAGEKELLVVNIGGKFYAMDNRCPHMNGDLSTGTLAENIVTCPKHGSQFDVINAKNLRGPKVAFIKMKGKDLESYQTKVEGVDVMVDL